MFKKTLIFCLLPVMLAGGCSTPNDSGWAELEMDEGSCEDAVIVPVNSVSLAKTRAAAGEQVKNFSAQDGQLMVFTASLTLQVADMKNTLAQCQILAKEYQGFVKRLNDNRVILAVPVKRADEVLSEIKTLGAVLSQEITADNVTEQSINLNIRIDNLEKSRKRLLEFLEKTKDVKDIVQVEKELTRVTTELERLQAQKNNLQKQIDYVTITVNLRPGTVVREERPSAPIGWINSLGSSLLSQKTVTPGAYGQPFDYILPNGFMMSGFGEALSAGRCVLVFRKLPNGVTVRHWLRNEYTALDFYRPMIVEALEKRFGSKPQITETQCDSLPALIFSIDPEIGKDSYRYWILVCVDGSAVYTVEAYGKQNDVNAVFSEKVQKKLISSINF